MTTLRLWYSPGACSLAAHIVLEESGLPFEKQRVNVRQGPSAELIAINPKGQVPVFEMDGQIITEVSAIITAISQLVPGKDLLGQTPLDVVRCYEWFSYMSVALHKQAFGVMFRPGKFSDDPSTHDGIRARGRQNAIDALEVIERQLVSNNLVGNSFTAADAYFFVFYRWATLFLKLDMADKFPKCTALIEELLKRPAVIAALRTEEIGALSQNL